MGQHKLLVVTDLQSVPLVTILDAIKVVRRDEVEQLDPLIIAQANGYCLIDIDSSSIDDVACLCESSQFPCHPLLGPIARVLKPGGIILLYLNPHSWRMMDSSLEHKLVEYEFLDIQSSSSQPFWVMGKKPPPETGSSFSMKETSQVLPKAQVADDVNLIDADSPLAKVDVRKRQRPSH